MRKTEVQIRQEEQKRSRNFILNPKVWPIWPYCPLKNTKTSEIGIIIEDGKDKYTIYLINLFEIKGLETFKNARKIEFSNVDELLVNGWIVD